MFCKKCGGPVYHDNMYRSKSFIDLACIMCGKRWHIAANNPVARLVLGERTPEVVANRLMGNGK